MDFPDWRDWEGGSGMSALISNVWWIIQLILPSSLCFYICYFTVRKLINKSACSCQIYMLVLQDVVQFERHVLNLSDMIHGFLLDDWSMYRITMSPEIHIMSCICVFVCVYICVYIYIYASSYVNYCFLKHPSILMYLYLSTFCPPSVLFF